MKRGFCNITVDIETWGGPNKPTLDDVQVPGNYTKPESIAKYKEDNLPKAWAAQALESLKGEILTIGVAYENDPVEVLVTEGDEQDLMHRFGEWLFTHGINEISQIWWVGHSIAGFDLPWILHRSWKYCIPFITALIPTYKYDEHIVDIQRIFAGTSDKMYKMDYIAKYFGLPGKTSMDGSMVHDAYLQNRLADIAEYCKSDVSQEREVAMRLKPEIWDV